jgi:hypothetical protein
MEVIAKIEFTTPCLGGVRRDDCDLMQRDRDGNVIFMPSWWKAALTKAAKALSKYHRMVEHIYPALVLNGQTTIIRRQFGPKPKDFKCHEGFDTGASVTCGFTIPYGTTIEQFTELLEAVGMYIGVSPYGWQTNYGRFRVLSVESAAKAKKIVAKEQILEGQ